MGMFDSVFVTCPACGVEIEFQSKAGDCLCAHYRLDSVPPEIAIDLQGATEQCACGHVVRLETNAQAPKQVPIWIAK
jgi:hypothetical protein